jgi:hypothetical protein
MHSMIAITAFRDLKIWQGFLRISVTLSSRISFRLGMELRSEWKLCFLASFLDDTHRSAHDNEKVPNMPLRMIWTTGDSASRQTLRDLAVSLSG